MVKGFQKIPERSGLLRYRFDEKDCESIVSELYDFVVKNADKLKRDEPNKIGEIDTQGYVYIKKSVVDGILHDMHVNERAFLSWAKRRGYVLCSEGRTTIAKRFHGDGVYRCVCFYAPALERLETVR
jgi:hypothetical protein